MKIAEIDYYASRKNTFLHFIPIELKFLLIFLVLLTVLTANNLVLLGILYLVILLITCLTRVPSLKIIKLSLYPLVFIVLYVFSIDLKDYIYAVLIALKALISALTFVLLIFTTSYIDIFSKLSNFLPSFLVMTLFITYRSIFILGAILENIKLAIHLRGKINFKKPIYTIKMFSEMLGYTIIRAIETSENVFECLKVRGYSGNFRYLRK